MRMQFGKQTSSKEESLHIAKIHRHRESLMLGFRYETVKITMLRNQMCGDEFCKVNFVELIETFRTFNIAGITIMIIIELFV